MPAQPPPSFTCTEPWMYYTGLWFWTSPSDQLASYEEAKQICAGRGAQLASGKYDYVLRLAYKQMVQIPGQEMWIIDKCEYTGACRKLTDKETPQLSYANCDCASKKRFTCVKQDPDKAAQPEQSPINLQPKPVPPVRPTPAQGSAWHCKDNKCQQCNYLQRNCAWPYYTSLAYCRANCK
jgi:hypothetical protein